MATSNVMMCSNCNMSCDFLPPRPQIQIALLFILLVAIADVVIGSFIPRPAGDRDIDRGFTGYSCKLISLRVLALYTHTHTHTHGVRNVWRHIMIVFSFHVLTIIKCTYMYVHVIYPLPFSCLFHAD